MGSKQLLPAIIQDHPLSTVTYDKKTGFIKEANKSAIRSFGYSRSGWTMLKISDFIVLEEKDRGGKVFTGSAIAKSGKIVPIKGYFKTITDHRRKYFLVIVHERTGDPSNKLEAEHSRLEKIVKVSHNEIYLIRDSTLAFDYANTAGLKNLGYTLAELAKLKLTDLFSFPDQMALQALLNSLRRSETDRLNLQLKYTRKNGSHYDADVLIQKLEKEPLFLLIVTDISDKLIAEKKLLDTIQEKETLIKEIHHRVKNNLQLISSIIYLKLSSIGESDIRNFLEDTRQKIRSIALIHERLLQTEKLDKVEISDYLGKLIHDLQITYYRQDLALELKTNVQEKMMNLDTAIICGLIVNELVTNAIKHAFRGLSHGFIAVFYNYNEKLNQSQLIIEDNGVSLPDEIMPGRTNSFGMQLIDVFVKQLGGTIEINRQKGTKFQIHF